MRKFVAYFIDVPRFDDKRGSLCVVERFLPFTVQRVYYIFDVVGERGGHRHRATEQAFICLSGSCTVAVNDGLQSNSYHMDEPHKCLIVEPKDWHTMSSFSDTATLLVLASKLYDVSDYIDEPY
jgi:dTDP-4-dehydrorhamnose 3,5-epimerase-like enzyme